MATIFVTGPTGVLGRATIPRLLAAGYRVRALSRSVENDRAVVDLGAEPVRADLFDPASLADALAGATVVMHLATRIPPSTTMRRPTAWHENDRIREDGARNLVDAAANSRVETMVFPSFAFVYPDCGDRWIDAAATPVRPVQNLDSAIAAEREVMRFAETPGRRGIVLRLGALYGPGLSSSDEQLNYARRGISFIGSRRGAFMPTLWIEDAGSALVAAVERAPTGIYDVVDDEPLRQGEISVQIARAVCRKRLFSPPAWLLRRLAGTSGDALLRSLRISNRRFRDATGWQPSMPNAREGMARLGTLNPASSPNVPYSARVGLAAMTAFALTIGVWQQFAPRSFYDTFPGLGRQWVAVDGPFNEHLIRDIGGTSLAIGVISLYALARPSSGLVRAVAAGFLISQAPHFMYHLAHLGLLASWTDRLWQTVSLLVILLISLMVLLKSGEIGREPAQPTEPRAVSDRSAGARPREVLVAR
ncbi:MAG: NAD(P)-dependent oxidoreductase [Thermomicrobiales bacterium]